MSNKAMTKNWHYTATFLRSLEWLPAYVGIKVSSLFSTDSCGLRRPPLPPDWWWWWWWAPRWPLCCCSACPAAIILRTWLCVFGDRSCQNIPAKKKEEEKKEEKKKKWDKQLVTAWLAMQNRCCVSFDILGCLESFTLEELRAAVIVNLWILCWQAEIDIFLIFFFFF